MFDMCVCIIRVMKLIEKVMCVRVIESMFRFMFRLMKKIISEIFIRSFGMVIGVSISRGSMCSLK